MSDAPNWPPKPQFVLPEDDPYHMNQLLKLTPAQMLKVLPPPYQAGCSLIDCLEADARSHNVIRARRAKKGEIRRLQKARMEAKEQGIPMTQEEVQSSIWPDHERVVAEYRAKIEKYKGKL